MSAPRFDLSFDGPRASGTTVQFYGMFEGPWSTAAVCTQMGRLLAERISALGLYSYNGPGYADSELAAFGHIDPDAPIGIYYGFPNEVPDRFFDHPFRIGGFVCETDRITTEWVDVCNSMDLVIVPTSFCKQAFHDSGVRVAVMVVPHGIEPAYRPHAPKSRGIPMLFYNTFHDTSDLYRKGIDELVGCFLEAFGRSGNDARLVLRTQITRDLVDIRGRHDFGAAVRLMPMNHLDTEAFAFIYSQVHCTVHPSRGEGFGFVPLQSIACETPVIAPPVTGMSDYLDDTNSIPLRTSGRARGRHTGNAAGTYFDIDEDHLVELLLDVHRNWEDHYARVRAAAPSIRRRYAWPKVLEAFTRVVEEAARSDDVGPIRRELAQRYGP